MKIKLFILLAVTPIAFGSWHQSTVPLGMEYWAEAYTQQDAEEVVSVLNGVEPTNPDIEALEAKWQQRVEVFGKSTVPTEWEYWVDKYTYQDAEEIVWVLNDINPTTPEIEALTAKWEKIMAQFGQKVLNPK